MGLRRLVLLALCLSTSLCVVPQSAVAQGEPPLRPRAGEAIRARAAEALRDRLKESRYKICVVSQAGMARCLTSGAFRDFNRHLLTPNQAKLVNDLFDDFARDHGVEAGDIFAACHERWRRVDVRAGRSPAPAAAAPGAALSAIEQKAVLNSCAARAGGGAGGVGSVGGADLGVSSERQKQIDSAVSGMDAGFSKCRDSAMARRVGEELSEIEKAYIRKFGAPLDKVPGTSTRDLTGRHVNNDQPTNEIIFKGAFLQAILALGEWAKEHQRDSEAAEIEKIVAEETIKAIEAAAQRKEQEGEGRASAEEEKAAQQCLEGTQCVDPEAPKPGYPAPDGAGSTCAERQARWERFKTHCARSNWREFRCEQFLRLVNGCADITTILPTPDGDATCVGRKIDEEKRRAAAAQDCEKRSLIAMPGEDGVIKCKSDLTDMRPPVADICSDPRAQPGQDQCFSGSTDRGRGGRPAPGRPAP